MEALNELVVSFVASDPHGRAARKRTALPSGCTGKRADRPRALTGTGTARSPGCSRRSGASERMLPRCARHTLGGGVAAGHQLCASQLSAEARLRSDYFADPG